MKGKREIYMSFSHILRLNMLVYELYRVTSVHVFVVSAKSKSVCIASVIKCLEFFKGFQTKYIFISFIDFTSYLS